MIAQCTSCKSEVASNEDNRLPAWCPHCGGNLTIMSAAAVPSPAEPAGPASAPVPTREATPVPEPPAAEPVPRLDDLGAPEAVYRGSGSRCLVAWVVALVCFGLVAAVGYGVLHQPQKKPTAGIGLMILFGASGLAAAYMALTLAETSYLVFPAALVHKRGDATKIIPWSHIREVNQKIHPTWQSYQVLARGGVDITLTGDIKNHRALGQQIEDKVLAHALPAALAQLERGESMRFGPLALNRHGVFVDGALSPWSQTSMSIGIRMEHVNDPTDAKLMHLHIYTQVRTRALAVEIGQITNFRLMLEIVRHYAPQCLPPGV